MMRKVIIKYKRSLLFIIGCLLVGISIILVLYSRIVLVRERVLLDFNLLISDNNDNVNSSVDSNIDINTDYIDDSNEESETNDVLISDEDLEASNHNDSKKNYIGYLVIPRISLKYGLVAKDSYYNNVNRNLQIIKESEYPNVNGGNLIIAGHSGTSTISYFRDLYRLKIGDTASVIYKNNTYKYTIKNIYKEDRDGTINIKRNPSKTTLTLITCSFKDKKHQTVYIAELNNVVLGG